MHGLTFGLVRGAARGSLANMLQARGAEGLPGKSSCYDAPGRAFIKHAAVTRSCWCYRGDFRDIRVYVCKTEDVPTSFLMVSVDVCDELIAVVNVFFVLLILL